MRGDRIYLKAKAAHEKMYISSGQIKEEDRKNIYNEYFKLLKRAAYLGHADAQYDLGQQYETMNYLSIENPKYNPAKCIYWYTKASVQNHAAACNNLATFYESGEGCEKDVEKALALYKRSADLGYSPGKKNYKIMKRQMR
ncbi:MAG TPA: tetratricopeptide repeat protein [Niastella sp.]